MVTWGPSTTTTFGTSTPASTTGGGTSAAAPSAFNFGGGAPSTPPLTPQTPAGNPPPLSTGFSFGGGAAAPAPSGGLFGSAAPAPSGGLFGSTTAPAPSGGLFGSNPAPAPTGSLFGSNSAPAPSGGLFGSTAPAPSGGLFGSTAPAPSGGLFGSSASAPSGGLFGTTPATAAPFGAQTNPHQAAYHAHQSASAQQEAARIQEAVSNLQSKYSSTAPGAPNVPSSHCAFTAILYDALTGEQRSAIASLSTTQTTTYLNNQMASMSLSATVIPRPPHIPPKVWNEAQARNPNHGELTPVALIGASALHSRLVGQQEKATKLGQDATKLKESLDFLSKACTKSRTGIRQASLEQEALQRRLLEVMRKVEIVRCMGQPIQQAEREGMDRMERLLRDVNVLTRGMMDVEERAREQSRVWKRKAASGMSGNVDWTLDNEDKAALMEVLNEQSWGLDGLSHIVKRDERDVGILKEELEKAYNTSNSSVGSDRTKKPIQVGEGGVAIFTGH